MKYNAKLMGLLVIAAILVSGSAARAYVEVPHSLGLVVAQSTVIVVMKVEKVDREKNLIIFRKVKDLKGTHPTEVIKHNIGKAGLNPREAPMVMEGAQVGATAIFFHNGSASETFLGNYWYQTYPGDWWTMSHGEPFLLRTFSGKPEKLISAVQSMLAGQEVIVSCMVDDKPNLHIRTAKVQRMRASLKLQDYNAKRDFVGWGSEDFRFITGMPAFLQYTAIARTDPEASGVTSADIDGDGKPDLCIFGAGKVAVLKNAGSSIDEVSIPYAGGARAACFADWNGDNKPDLLLATPGGPMLLTNVGDGTFRDDTALLPRESYYALTTAAWIDFDGDKKPDILLANGFLGMRLYRNLGAPAANAPKAPAFEDISDKVALGTGGLAAGIKGFALSVADLDGDGRADFIYSAGLVARNTPGGFVAMNDCGVVIKPGRVAPLVQDFDGDGKPDITLVDGNAVKLFKNVGGKFSDVTGQRGDLTKPIENINCIAWSDFYNKGSLDLMVGVSRGTNRLFKGSPEGKFTDASDEAGFSQRIFNTRAMTLVDLNNDKVLDLVMNNEGQESSVLLGDPKRNTKKVAVGK